jgi:hypothetical protein
MACRVAGLAEIGDNGNRAGNDAGDGNSETILP